MQKLSQREIEILRKIADGHDAGEIANSLNVSVHTVQTHRRNMIRKLSAKNTVAVVTYAIRQGII